MRPLEWLSDEDLEGGSTFSGPVAGGGDPTGGDGPDSRPGRDVVLVTVDCWRHDALEWMPRLRAHVEAAGYVRAEAVCAAPATRGAFAAIHGGRHYPFVYEGFDEVRADVVSLPATFGSAGYATGGFVGSNPFLSAWKDDFDRFWNDRLDADPGGSLRERIRSVAATLRQAGNRVQFRSRAPVGSVARRAQEWYLRRERPRFLWVHLMDPHVPFLPGLRKAVGIGPLSVYRAHGRFASDPGSLDARDRSVLRACYRASLEYLDERIDGVLSFLDDDAVVVLVGDHGEEFDHGAFGHARLYDETVRVPLLARGLDGVRPGDMVRQIDLAPTLAASAGLVSPGEWRGRPHDGLHRSAFLLNHSPRFGRTYAGLRTERHKLVRTADADTDEVLEWELYDLARDPHERRNRADDIDDSSLYDRLSSFLDRDGLRERMLERPRTDTSDVVEDRLTALGYQ